MVKEITINNASELMVLAKRLRFTFSRATQRELLHTIRLSLEKAKEELRKLRERYQELQQEKSEQAQRECENIKCEILINQKAYQRLKNQLALKPKISTEKTNTFSLAYQRFNRAQKAFTQIGNSHYRAIVGSTECGNDLPQTSFMVLDAEYQAGSAGATADGLGDFNNAYFNTFLARAAHFATKYATYYANLYTDPRELGKEMRPLLIRVGEVVKNKFLIGQPDAVGVVVTKAFYHNPLNIEVVAGGVGDAMVMVWRHKLKKVLPIISAQQFANGFQYNPVSITEALIPIEAIQQKLIKAEEGDVIIRMTDGAWELFPNDAQLSEDKKILTTRIDEKQWTEIFSQFYNSFLTTHQKEPVAIDYQKFLQKEIQHRIQARYEQLIGPTGIITCLKNDLETIAEIEELTVWEYLQLLQQSENPLAQYLKNYLHIFGYVMEKSILEDFPISEFIKKLNQPWKIGDDATCGIHLLCKDSCTPVQNFLLTPLISFFSLSPH